MYCLKCKSAQLPALSFAELTPWNDKIGGLSGFCPKCESLMNRSVGYRNYDASVGDLEVSMSEGLKRLIQGVDPSFNDNFKRDK